MKRIISSCVLTILLLFAATNSYALILTGVTASTNMGNGFGSVIGNIVDGSGLSSFALNATHASGTPSNAWAAPTETGFVTFNLNGLYNLDGMSVWNFNASNTAGVNGVNILTSLDGISFTALAGSPASFAIGNSIAVTPAQTFSWGTVTASFVRFQILSNHGFGGATGLSEVAFDGLLVPEPATVILLGIGLLGMFGYDWRRRKRSA